MGLAAKTLPPSIGFRIKSFTEVPRALVRTWTCSSPAWRPGPAAGVPVQFVVTLPKVAVPEAGRGARGPLRRMLRERLGIPKGAVGIDS
ncbi:MAG: hypothetical protein IPK07_35585 [Deltaproteobacteria bacterium]|nr:hypothetical protein [Deltaproteobacteria bacterium]